MGEETEVRDRSVHACTEHVTLTTPDVEDFGQQLSV